MPRWGTSSLPARAASGLVLAAFAAGCSAHSRCKHRHQTPCRRELEQESGRGEESLHSLANLIDPVLREKAHERFLRRLIERAEEESCTPGECGEKGEGLWRACLRHVLCFAFGRASGLAAVSLRIAPRPAVRCSAQGRATKRLVPVIAFLATSGPAAGIWQASSPSLAAARWLPRRPIEGFSSPHWHCTSAGRDEPDGFPNVDTAFNTIAAVTVTTDSSNLLAPRSARLCDAWRHSVALQHREADLRMQKRVHAPLRA